MKFLPLKNEILSIEQWNFEYCVRYWVVQQVVHQIVEHRNAQSIGCALQCSTKPPSIDPF